MATESAVKRDRIFVSRNLNTVRLRELMESKGWTQRTLAGKLKVGVSQVNRWLNGEVQPRSHVTIRIARMFRVNRNEILLPASGEK